MPVLVCIAEHWDVRRTVSSVRHRRCSSPTSTRADARRRDSAARSRRARDHRTDKWQTGCRRCGTPSGAAGRRPWSRLSSDDSLWTRARFRGTTDHDGLGHPMASPRWSRGSGGSVRALTSALPTQPTRLAPIATPEAVDAAGPMDAQTRPQVLAKPRRRGFAQAPTAHIFFVIRRPERKDPARPVQISTLLPG